MTEMDIHVEMRLSDVIPLLNFVGYVMIFSMITSLFLITYSIYQGEIVTRSEKCTYIDIISDQL